MHFNLNRYLYASCLHGDTNSPAKMKMFNQHRMGNEEEITHQFQLALCYRIFANKPTSITLATAAGSHEFSAIKSTPAVSCFETADRQMVMFWKGEATLAKVLC